MSETPTLTTGQIWKNNVNNSKAAKIRKKLKELSALGLYERREELAFARERLTLYHELMRESEEAMALVSKHENAAGVLERFKARQQELRTQTWILRSRSDGNLEPDDEANRLAEEAEDAANKKRKLDDVQ